MFLTPNDTDTAIFTVFGIGGNEPPADLRAMIDYAEKYTPAGFLNTVRAAEPIGKSHRYRIPGANGGATTKCADSPQACWSAGMPSAASTPSMGRE